MAVDQPQALSLAGRQEGDAAAISGLGHGYS